MGVELRGQATFLPDDPPRAGALAVVEPFAGDSVELVVATAHGPRRQTVPATRYALADVLPHLVEGAVESPSARFWAAAATWALTLVARGRLQPAVTDGGWDAWRIGPLDPDDADRFHALVAACPPEAHAIAVPGTRPLRMRSAGAVVRDFCDAVADTLVRTAAAPLTTEHPAYAATVRTDVSHLKPWFADTSRGLAGARAGLRIEETDTGDDLVAVIQLRGRDDPSLVVDATDLWSAPAAVLERLGSGAETDLLLALRRGARAWPPLAAVLDAPTPTDLPLDDDAIADLLGEGAEALTAAGLEVLWPKDLLLDGITVRAVTATPQLGSEGGSGFSLDQVLQFHFEAYFDGELLTEEELATLAEAKRPLVRLRGRWLKVDAALIDRIRRRKPQRLSGMEALAASLTGRIVVEDEVVEFVAEGGVADLAQRLSGIAASRETQTVEPPEGLRATLRPYQLRGLRWLAEMTQLGLGGCLADDMGLGKTVQLIALHLYRRGSGPTLVVCPTSLLGNWEREVNRFAPDVPVRRFHGGERHLHDVAKDEIVLATYGMVRRDRAALAEVGWGLVTADEAQHVKNPLSRGARELRAIPAQARVALTGTPVENRLTDLWSILDWTTPGLLGPLDRFRRTVAVPVERYHDTDATERLARVVRPFLLRRRKSDPGIAPELPAKIETDRVVPLTAEQATLYQAVVTEALENIATKAGIERRGLVLKLLTGLKQICNHPAQYLHQDGPLAGRSGKLAALDELTDVIVDEGDGVLVFSQYVAMGTLLQAHLAARGVDTLFLHGGVPARKREEMVARFQSGAVPVFLLSLKAGGTGLNLTRATHVIHYDRWWNPAVEDQATDRAYRIGQDRAVQVHRLMTEGTLEDRIAAVMADKRALADSVVGAGEAWLSELSDNELAELVSLA
jgi:superfamily II DNA or RNA helicase